MKHFLEIYFLICASLIVHACSETPSPNAPSIDSLPMVVDTSVPVREVTPSEDEWPESPDGLAVVSYAVGDLNHDGLLDSVALTSSFKDKLSYLSIFLGSNDGRILFKKLEISDAEEDASVSIDKNGDLFLGWFEYFACLFRFSGDDLYLTSFSVETYGLEFDHGHVRLRLEVADWGMGLGEDASPVFVDLPESMYPPALDIKYCMDSVFTKNFLSIDDDFIQAKIDSVMESYKND
ncbi:MAG: hypothetical protein IK131_00910 [Paludibacteraceae bacterium]|nr:hypothetical protein [Paludibacteraceae bacterium]